MINVRVSSLLRCATICTVIAFALFAGASVYGSSIDFAPSANTGIAAMAFSGPVPPDGFSGPVPPDGFSGPVPPDGFSGPVPPDGFSA